MALTEVFDEELPDDEADGPWCPLHERAHPMGGLACETSSAESWWGVSDSEWADATVEDRAHEHDW